MPEFFTVPDSCFVCGCPTVVKGSFLYCENKSCSARASGAIKVWIDRLGLLNWGESLIDSLTNGPVNQIGDLYRLSVEDIALHCSGMKHARKCFDILHANKSVSLELVLASLNIPNLGISTATDIVNAGFDSVSKVINITLDQLVSIPNVGEKTAAVIKDGLEEKRDMLLDLDTVIEIKLKSVGLLTGKSFCITGNTAAPRRSLQKQIIDNGGIVKESVTSGLSYLVTNEDLSIFSSDKVKKARKYNTNIISESDLISLMKA